MKRKLSKKKGQFYMLWWIIKLFFLVAVVFSVVTLVKSYVVTDIDTFASEANIFISNMITSPDGFVYVDELTGRAYPGIIDEAKFVRMQELQRLIKQEPPQKPGIYLWKGEEGWHKCPVISVSEEKTSWSCSAEDIPPKEARLFSVTEKPVDEEVEPIPEQPLDKAFNYGIKNTEIAAKITRKRLDGVQQGVLYYNKEGYDRWYPLAKTGYKGPGGKRELTKKVFVLFRKQDGSIVPQILEFNVIIPNT